MHVTEIPARGHARWRQSLSNAVRDVEVLCRRLRLTEDAVESAKAGADGFPILVPESYVKRMRPGDARDPLLLQVLPVREETQSLVGFVSDPVGDLAARREPGLIQKYDGRVLLVVSGACAVHCRYCFRRHYPYEQDARGMEHLSPAIERIARDRSIREVILSGGDPLVRTDSWLASLVRRIADIAHVQTLRVHTRLPIVLPDRITDELLGWLTESRLTPVVVVHVNHANELADDCVLALESLRGAGALLLNQSVLLRGVNDNADALADLSRQLVTLGILPYYLHQLDRVHGSAHFEVPEAEGVAIIQEMRRRLPGYLVPRYVRETPGASSKQPVDLVDLT